MSDGNDSVFFCCNYKRRCLFISKQEHSINEEIRDEKVRLIGADGAQLGILSAKEALKKAEAADMDLVKIAPNSDPPVCKIMDYGKYKFDQAKREKEARKSQKVVETKEVRLGINIDVHDFNTKLKHTQRFIAAGDKVKVSIRFKGRAIGHTEIGLDTMNRFADACREFANIEKEPKMEGRNMLMFLAPKKN